MGWAVDRVVFATVAVPLSIESRVANGVREAVETLLLGVAQALFGLITKIFVKIIDAFIVIEPTPRNVPGLLQLQQDLVMLYVALLGIAALVLLAMMQLFPNSPKTDPYRFGERALAATIFVLAAPWLLDFSVQTVNVLTRALMPSGGMSLPLDDGFINPNAAMGVIPVALFGKLLAVKLLIAILIFFTLLTMRVVIVHSVFALMPLLMFMWIVDVGPGKYAHMVAEMAFKLFAIMLIAGVLVGGMMSVADEIAGGNDTELSSDDWENMDAEAEQAQLQNTAVGVLVFGGSIWMSIAVLSVAVAVAGLPGGVGSGAAGAVAGAISGKKSGDGKDGGSSVAANRGDGGGADGGGLPGGIDPSFSGGVVAPPNSGSRGNTNTAPALENPEIAGALPAGDQTTGMANPTVVADEPAFGDLSPADQRAEIFDRQDELRDMVEEAHQSDGLAAKTVKAGLTGAGMAAGTIAAPGVGTVVGGMVGSAVGEHAGRATGSAVGGAATKVSSAALEGGAGELVSHGADRIVDVTKDRFNARFGDQWETAKSKGRNTIGNAIDGVSSKAGFGSRSNKHEKIFK